MWLKTLEKKYSEWVHVDKIISIRVVPVKSTKNKDVNYRVTVIVNQVGLDVFSSPDEKKSQEFARKLMEERKT